MNFNMEEHLKVERSVVYGQKCVQISTSCEIFCNKTWNLIPTTSYESKVKTISFCGAHTFITLKFPNKVNIWIYLWFILALEEG